MKPSSIGTLILLLLVLTLLVRVASSREDNGFDLTDSLVPVDEIHLGGPPRDGIPALDRPQFVAATEVGFLDPDDRVLGLSWGGQIEAYPVAILDWHEIVNDELGGEQVAITYCPLCGTGMTFASRVGGKKLTFGVSRLLYNSDVLLYDRETESLWSQLRRSAQAFDDRDKLVPGTIAYWFAWFAFHPETAVFTTRP